MRRRYLPLRHDTTIFALVQVLLEVAFPEQEMQYIQATVQQTHAYRKPRYDIPIYLEGRPHKVQSLCLLNIERGLSIPRSYLSQHGSGKFSITPSHGGEKWLVDIKGGECTCPVFQSTKIPCKHFFAIFHHFPTWGWKDLPPTLTESPHMLLDSSITEIERFTDSIEVDEDESSVSNAQSTTQSLPLKNPQGRNIYKLQKQIEDSLARCRTLAYLTNDISALEECLSHCEMAMKTLSTSATTTTPGNPPVFNLIAKAGVEEYRSTTKTLHRVGTKRKQIKKAKPVKKLKLDPLLQTATRSVGRPKLKRAQRKQPPLPRQVNEFSKSNMLKAAILLRKGNNIEP